MRIKMTWSTRLFLLAGLPLLLPGVHAAQGGEDDFRGITSFDGGEGVQDPVSVEVQGSSSVPEGAWCTYYAHTDPYDPDYHYQWFIDAQPVGDDYPLYSYYTGYVPNWNRLGVTVWLEDGPPLGLGSIDIMTVAVGNC